MSRRAKGGLRIARAALGIVLLVLVALAAPVPSSNAQAPATTPRIGLLGDAPPLLLDAFRQGLRDVGLNATIEHRAADWRIDRLSALAAELVRLKVDVIVATSPNATQAAKEATATIPIVFAVSGDPVAEGFVASLARPGGNITGLATLGPELVGKQLEMLRAIVPAAGRIAVLHNTTQRSHPGTLRHAEDAARRLGLRLQMVGASSPSEIDAAFATMASQRAAGVLVLRDAFFRVQRAQITSLAARSRLPAMYGLREEAEAGGLIAYGAGVPQLFARAASYVDRILKGARPADLPVEQPTTFELVVNLKTAQAMGLTIPASLLGQADLVIR